METKIIKRQFIIDATKDTDLVKQMLSTSVDESINITESSDLVVTSEELSYTINYKKKQGVFEEFVATCSINSYKDQASFYFGTICIRGGYITPTLLMNVPSRYADMATNDIRQVYDSLCL